VQVREENLVVHGFRGCEERTDFVMLCGTCVGYSWTKPMNVRVKILTLLWLWSCNHNKLREGEKTLDAEAIAH
jgi:hypothetical protein